MEQVVRARRVPDANVMLTRRRINAAFLLGVVILTRPGCAGLNGPVGVLPPGEWRGDHISLAVTGNDATIEFDCAYGRLSGPIQLRNGDFIAGGTYMKKPGLLDDAEGSAVLPARYHGRVRGARMSLTVMLPAEARRLGTYALQAGRTGRELKCL